MRAAVVGTGWGQVHVAALQGLGVEVVALCGGSDEERTRDVARRHGIPQAFSGIAELPGMDLDLITIAAPTTLHAQMVAALGPTPLLCDKPAVGVETPVALAPRPTGPVWVNYAFPFLEIARQVQATLTHVGRIERVDVGSYYDLGELVPEHRSPWQWFCDVATHPWSWAVARFGLPDGDEVHTDAMAVPRADAATTGLTYRARQGEVVTVSATRVPGLRGLRHFVRVTGEAAVVSFDGQFSVGGQWRFGPVVVDESPTGAATSPAETPGDPTPEPGRTETGPAEPDPWFRANVAAIGAVVSALRSGAAPQPGHSPGTGGFEPHPFTWDAALAMDACAQRAARTSRR